MTVFDPRPPFPRLGTVCGGLALSSHSALQQLCHSLALLLSHLPASSLTSGVSNHPRCPLVQEAPGSCSWATADKFFHAYVVVGARTPSAQQRAGTAADRHRACCRRVLCLIEAELIGAVRPSVSGRRLSRFSFASPSAQRMPALEHTRRRRGKDGKVEHAQDGSKLCGLQIRKSSIW